MTTFRLPDLGEGLAEAEIVEWHVKPGEQVVVDQPMVSVETAKAVVELPVPFSGVVSALHAAAGDVVPTGAPLIDFDSGSVVGSMPVTSEEEFVDNAAPGRDRGNGAMNGGGEARGRAVPVARALAKRLGVDLSTVDGTGRGGLITLDDVLERAHVTAASPAIARLAAESGMTPAPLRGTRRAMAHSMSLARDQIAGSTVFDDADIQGWRHGGDYMVRLMRAMTAAWRAEPALNAWYDSVNNARILFKHIDLAIAVDTASGLIVPVLREIETKSSDELRAALVAQKAAARARSTAADDLRDFTLMLSNFGTLAGRYGIPLVVPPAVAILGAGKVRRDAVVVGDAIAAHRRMPLSLSFDHRCVTGAEACRYLAAVIADLERPE
jgi:pyruvate dehydrogenase E2 component (dihydrolipoamide acetyltransferase)